MNKPFNELTDAEAERLAILAEECAEVIKCVGKILRHGYESYDPTGQVKGTNREQLEREIGDVHAIAGFMAGHGDTTHKGTSEAFNSKLDKFHEGRAYLHHQ